MSSPEGITALAFPVFYVAAAVEMIQAGVSGVISRPAGDDALYTAKNNGRSRLAFNGPVIAVLATSG